MSWRRVKEEGVDPAHRKTWVSSIYRIIWRDQFMGVTVAPGFQVSYRDNGRWELLTGQRLKKTFNAAKQLCEEDRRVRSA